MSILQPTLSVISPGDFRDNAYCFPVESVVTQKEFTGMLTVGTSAGYLLTTSQTNELRREQTLEHIQQSDGSWIAKGNINLIASGNALVNGTIVIRNSLSESIALTIDVTPTALAKPKSTSLAINQPTLTFASTSPGKPSFLIVTVDPQHTDAPLRLTTDAPDYFQLASDSRPVFLPDLSLAPSSTETAVHIRYSTKRPGVHRGQLTIHGALENQTILLEGRTTRLLPTIKPGALRYSAQYKALAQKSALFLAFAVVSGLAYVGYANRCQLFPALCREEVMTQVNTPPVTSTQLPTPSGERSNEDVVNTSTFNQENEEKNPGLVRSVQKNSSIESVEKNSLVETSDATAKARSDAYTPEVRQRMRGQTTDSRSEGKSTVRKASTAEEESELEKVLNQEL